MIVRLISVEHLEWKMWKKQIKNQVSQAILHQGPAVVGKISLLCLVIVWQISLPALSDVLINEKHCFPFFSFVSA